MADYLRARVCARSSTSASPRTCRSPRRGAHHDYAHRRAARLTRTSIFGNWLQIDPRTGSEGAAEFERCDASEHAALSAFAFPRREWATPASDPIYDPFYEASHRADRPVLVLVGFTGAARDSRAAGGVKLDLCHPRYIDELAIRFPDLKIIAGRNPWPWPDDMIAVMLHKPNVWIEFHGWSPKYLGDSWKRDIARRLKNRVMFGADYPLFTYERLVADWRSLDYDEASLQRSISTTRSGCSRARPGSLSGWIFGSRGKVAIVGGASQGIGFAIARLLAAEGADGSRWSRAGATRSTQAVARVRRKAADEPSPSPADIRKADDCERIVAMRTRQFGRLDMLVNNDGAPPLGRLDEFDDAAWSKAVEQNLMSVVRLTRHAIPHLRAAGGGSIVNITALSVLQPIATLRPVGRDVGRRARLREDAVARGRRRQDHGQYDLPGAHRHRPPRQGVRRRDRAAADR